MGREKRERLYRKRGRYYADVRDYSDVGGRREALVPRGERSATRDWDEAYDLLTDRLEELQALRRGRKERDPLLKDYTRRHLRLKGEDPTKRPRTVERDELSLSHILSYFGEEIHLSEIDVRGLTDYQSHRRKDVSENTIRLELYALSNLYKRAVAEGAAVRNPVARLPEKPSDSAKQRGEAVYLEPGEAARLLRKAREADDNPHSRAIPFLHPLLATFLYTGARSGGVFGLLVRDVDFDNGHVWFRENEYRSESRKMRRRWVPLWPDLREILTTYIEEYNQTDGLLFPSPRGGMIRDIRGSFNAAVDAAKIVKGKNVTPTTLRHTYCATRLQTLDQGAPVSPYTVAKEMGHRSLKMIEERYGHLLKTRNRSAVVEYREAEVVPIEAGLKTS